MRYLIFFLLLFNSVLYSQSDSEKAMEKFANQDWIYLMNDEIAPYNYCKPFWFRFNQKEFVTNKGTYGSLEKYEIKKIHYNDQDKSLEIYSEITGVTLKITIKEIEKYKVLVSFRYIVDVENDSDIKYDSVAIIKSQFKKLERAKACDSVKSKKSKREESFEEPPAPPQ